MKQCHDGLNGFLNSLPNKILIMAGVLLTVALGRDDVVPNLLEKFRGFLNEVFFYIPHGIIEVTKTFPFFSVFILYALGFTVLGFYLHRKGVHALFFEVLFSLPEEKLRKIAVTSRVAEFTVYVALLAVLFFHSGFNGPEFQPLNTMKDVFVIFLLATPFAVTILPFFANVRFFFRLVEKGKEEMPTGILSFGDFKFFRRGLVDFNSEMILPYPLKLLGLDDYGHTRRVLSFLEGRTNKFWKNENIALLCFHSLYSSFPSYFRCCSFLRAKA